MATQLEWVGIPVYIPSVLLAVILGMGSYRSVDKRYYNYLSRYVFLPHPILQMILWFLFTAVCGIASYIFWRLFEGATFYFVTSILYWCFVFMVLASLAMGKMVAGRLRREDSMDTRKVIVVLDFFAFLVTFLLAVAVTVFYALSGAWASFAMFLAADVWLFFVMVWAGRVAFEVPVFRDQRADSEEPLQSEYKSNSHSHPVDFSGLTLPQ